MGNHLFPFFEASPFPRSAPAMARKPGTGRKKIEIKKIEDKSRRHTTFSKRRSGIFKKAALLSSEGGDDVAVIIFSPAGRPYTFGDPSVDGVLHRYIAETATTTAASSSPSPPSPGKNPSPSRRQCHYEEEVRKLRREHLECLNRMEVDKRVEELLEMAAKKNGGRSDSLLVGIENLGLQQLDQLECAMKEMMAKLTARMQETGDAVNRPSHGRV